MARNRSSKQRVSTDAPAGDAWGDNPFASLDGNGLPQGDAPAVGPSEQKQSKRRSYSFHIGLEKRGPKGKWTTLIIPQEPMAEAELKQLLKVLQSRAASGASMKPAQLEIQGEHCALVERYLKAQGHRTKRTGAAGSL